MPVLRPVCPDSNPDCLVKALRQLPSPNPQLKVGDVTTTVAPVVVEGQTLTRTVVSALLTNPTETDMLGVELLLRVQPAGYRDDGRIYALGPVDVPAMQSRRAEAQVLLLEEPVGVWVLSPAQPAPAAAAAAV